MKAKSKESSTREGFNSVYGAQLARLAVLQKRNRRPARCSAEYQEENRKLDFGPRLFCDCDRGHPGNHAVLCCTHKLKAKILVQWPNEKDQEHIRAVRNKAGRKMA